jgi:hypothetical protein
MGDAGHAEISSDLDGRPQQCGAACLRSRSMSSLA